MTAPLTAAHVQGAIDIISDESRWCQRTFARDKSSQPIFALSEGACSWCAFGALIKASGIPDLQYVFFDGPSALAEVNDEQGRLPAIAALEALRDTIKAKETGDAQ